MKKIVQFCLALFFVLGFISNTLASYNPASRVMDDEELFSIDDPKAYPNPFKTKITINHSSADKIEICSLLGETIKTFSISNFDKTSVLDLSDLKKGVYFYVIKNNDNVIETRRIVKSE